MPYHAVEEKETGNPAEAVVPPPVKKPGGPTVCIVGDGNAAHVLIPL